MAGALTANAIDDVLGSAVVEADARAIASVDFLSPVDGANNALLTGIVILTEADAVDEITFQWCRCAPNTGLNDAAIGAAVGDPFVIDADDSELATSPIVVQAIDRGAGFTSAYALTVASADESGVQAAAVYADAVLYD